MAGKGKGKGKNGGKGGKKGYGGSKLHRPADKRGKKGK